MAATQDIGRQRASELQREIPQPGLFSNLMGRIGSYLVKRAARGQEIRIELTPEQYSSILSTWNERDPGKAARITFHVQDRSIASMDVAGYRYRGDTCCV